MLTDLAQRSAGVVQGNTADGATMVAWHTLPGITDQHWTVVNTSYNGHSGLLFESNLTTSSVMDLNVSAGTVALWHSLTGTNQLWWLASSTVSGAYYIHNVMTSDCLTDTGLGSQLTVSPCVTGNLQQIWYLP
ncbi:hypothetical protein ABH920_004319 [Catenulispora sp. EB89]|uniref:hypothetical protein n=1 Tax=Catenulispora sp. EB89 TaxID=3156257 RepID=UPI0035140048